MIHNQRDEVVATYDVLTLVEKERSPPSEEQRSLSEKRSDETKGAAASTR